jgi:hypothetical protein
MCHVLVIARPLRDVPGPRQDRRGLRDVVEQIAKILGAGLAVDLSSNAHQSGIEGSVLVEDSPQQPEHSMSPALIYLFGVCALADTGPLSKAVIRRDVG